ncbi:MAG TPA: MBL fold metallo-hydrolase, partial [Chryseolinea sp.]|nr:MBL fold metallo-hydrolase [Chryseolinea sp.]
GLDEIITTHLRYSQSVPNYKIFFHPLEKDAREIIFEDNAITVETIPLKHKLTCSGFLFREKPKPRRIDKATLPEGLLINQIAGLKKGEDVRDGDGNVLYKNEALTLSPRKSRSYAYCSDTAFKEDMINQIQSIDLLYHEATFTTEDEAKATETKHSTAAQAATIAKRATVTKLLVGHFSARYKDLNPILAEAKAIFPNTALALEGEKFTLQE